MGTQRILSVFLHNNDLWRIHVADNNVTYLLLHVKCQIFVSDFNDFGNSRQILIYVSIMKHHENLSSANPADTRGRTDGRTSMTNFVGAFTIVREKRQRKPQYFCLKTADGQTTTTTTSHEEFPVPCIKNS